ncbi:MAG: ABC transporter ATP-binding protein [Rhodobacteraceae bacterium]|nr:ABC transporter ATP-binding protein [Paracoccaceae bacterium]
MNVTSSILSVRDLGMSFGGVKAVDGLSLSVERGAIHGLIGPNGAGKTTTFNVISGYYTPSEGEVLFQGDRISGLPMYEVARRGVVRTFQHSTLFAEMTVLENALVGTHLAHRPKLAAAVAGLDKRDRNAALEKARAALDYFGLLSTADSRAGDLSHGHQRALGLAVAMASGPEVLLLDEPFTGMNPEETRTMMGLMEKLRDSGRTILIVEHDMRAIMGLCDRITVMNFGKLLTHGRPHEIRSHPEVISAYLGSARNVA